MSTESGATIVSLNFFQGVSPNITPETAPYFTKSCQKLFSKSFRGANESGAIVKNLCTNLTDCVYYFTHGSHFAFRTISV